MHPYSIKHILVCILLILLSFSKSNITNQLNIFKDEVLVEHENILKF